MRGFVRYCKKHENAKSHINAFKTWKVFNARQARDLRVDVMFSQARSEEIKRHTEEVRQDREMSKIITTVVLYLGKQEMPFRDDGENSKFSGGVYHHTPKTHPSQAFELFHWWEVITNGRIVV